MDDVYHVEIRRDRHGLYATVTGPGLPAEGDHRASDDMWELCTDITLAIQDANPAFTEPYRLIPAPKRSSWLRRHRHRVAPS